MKKAGGEVAQPYSLLTLSLYGGTFSLQAPAPLPPGKGPPPRYPMSRRTSVNTANVHCTPTQIIHSTGSKGGKSKISNECLASQARNAYTSIRKVSVFFPIFTRFFIHRQFLGAFEQSHNGLLRCHVHPNVCLYVCPLCVHLSVSPTVCIYQSESCWKDFVEI